MMSKNFTGVFLEGIEVMAGFFNKRWAKKPAHPTWLPGFYYGLHKYVHLYMGLTPFCVDFDFDPIDF